MEKQTFDSQSNRSRETLPADPETGDLPLSEQQTAGETVLPDSGIGAAGAGWSAGAGEGGTGVADQAAPREHIAGKP